MEIWIIIFIVYFLAVCLRYIFWPDKKSEQEKVKTIKSSLLSPRSAINDKGEIILVDKGMIIQLMQTYSILKDTMNIETLESRLEYAQSTLKLIKEAYKDNKDAYLMAVSGAFQFFLSNNVKQPCPIDIISLLDTSEDKMKEYYSACIVNCFSKFSLKMLEEINGLKTKPAKKKRMNNMNQCYEKCIELANKYGLDSSEKLFEIKKKISEFYDEDGVQIIN